MALSQGDQSLSNQQKPDRLERISLKPLSPDEALRGAMEVSPGKARKLKSSKKRASKRRKAKK